MRKKILGLILLSLVPLLLAATPYVYIYNWPATQTVAGGVSINSFPTQIPSPALNSTLQAVATQTGQDSANFFPSLPSIDGKMTSNVNNTGGTNTAVQYLATQVPLALTPIYAFQTQQSVSVAGQTTTGSAITLTAPSAYKYWTFGIIGAGGSGAVTVFAYPQCTGSYSSSAATTVSGTGNTVQFLNFGPYTANGMAASISSIAGSTTVTVSISGSN